MRVLLVQPPPVLAATLTDALTSRGHAVRTFTGDVLDRDQCRLQADTDVLLTAPRVDGNPDELVDTATRGVWNLLTTTRARLLVQLSTLRLLDVHDPRWHLDEQFPSRPSSGDPALLAAHLAELTSREITRARPVTALVLRLDEVVDDATFARGPVAPTWLHLDDALAAIASAVESPPPRLDEPRWRVLHLARGDANSRYPLAGAAGPPLRFAPTHTVDVPTPQPSPGTPSIPAGPPALTDLPPARRLLVLGAAGPLAAAAAVALRRRPGVVLRLTDLAPLAQLVSAQDGPRPVPTEAPHEEQVVDVTDAAAVSAAAEGMDGIVNCTVIRADPVQAFRVNVLGAYHVMQAAVEHGLRRVVHTGPAQGLYPHPVGHTDDTEIPADALGRPGDDLYALTKYLALEICRLFAQEHAIACPSLVFIAFLDPSRPPPWGHSHAVSWDDAAEAVARATEIDTLPRPCPVLPVLAPAPHRRYRDDTTRRLLGWEARDDLTPTWLRRRR